MPTSAVDTPNESLMPASSPAPVACTAPMSPKNTEFMRAPPTWRSVFTAAVPCVMSAGGRLFTAHVCRCCRMHALPTLRSANAAMLYASEESGPTSACIMPEATSMA